MEGADDYASLQEVLYRRMKRGLSGERGFEKLPDLLLMDGGEKQVAAVVKVLQAMKVDIPVAGMVKDDRHRTRGLVYQGKELDLKSAPELFRCIGTIQEEVHRFAIDYHKKLRGKRLETSLLDEIPGIGEKRKQSLFAHFGSIEAMAKATEEELIAACGIPHAVAQSIRKHLNNSIVKHP